MLSVKVVEYENFEHRMFRHFLFMNCNEPCHKIGHKTKSYGSL